MKISFYMHVYLNAACTSTTIKLTGKQFVEQLDGLNDKVAALTEYPKHMRLSIVTGENKNANGSVSHYTTFKDYDDSQITFERIEG